MRAAAWRDPYPRPAVTVLGKKPRRNPRAVEEGTEAKRAERKVKSELRPAVPFRFSLFTFRYPRLRSSRTYAVKMHPTRTGTYTACGRTESAGAL